MKETRNTHNKNEKPRKFYENGTLKLPIDYNEFDTHKNKC